MARRVFDLAGRRALVTGGASGIGAAIARALDEAGALTVVADIDKARAQALAAMLATKAAVEIDVRDRGSVDRAVRETMALIGGIDLLVANAGVSTMRRAVDLTDEDWDYNFDVNARGVFLTNQIVCR